MFIFLDPFSFLPSWCPCIDFDGHSAPNFVKAIDFGLVCQHAISCLTIKVSINMWNCLIIIPYSTLSSPPVSLKNLNRFKNTLQNFILKNLVLEITLKKIFLNFLFIRYDTTIIELLFRKNFLINLLLQALTEVSQNNYFFVSLFTPDHLNSIAFSSL